MVRGCKNCGSWEDHGDIEGACTEKSSRYKGELTRYDFCCGQHPELLKIIRRE